MTNLETKGMTMKWMPASFYDIFLGWLTLGREKSMRRELLDLIRISPGERILDLACGTGTCSLIASDDCGEKGCVVGVDANRAFLERARSKARSRPNVTFMDGLAEAIPCEDASFDVVLFILAFHHLPGDDLQVKVLREIFRVLRPGGRLLLVDFPQGDHHHTHVADNHHDHHHHHHFHFPHCQGGCCKTSHEQEDYENDRVLLLLRQNGFEQVHGQQVRLVSAMAVTACKKSE